MSVESFDQFAAEMDRLSGLRFGPPDLRTHWEALRDIPFEMLTAGISRAQRTRTDFPTPIELRQDVDAIRHQVRAAEPLEDRGRDLAQPVEFSIPHATQALRITREWRYYCEVCNDGGMRAFWCGAGQGKPWTPREVCERHGAHGGHEWVRRCECVDSNPAIQRRLDHYRQYAAQSARKS